MARGIAVDLIGAAEVASGAMRAEAEVLEAIADQLLLSEGKTARNLRRVAERLRLAADLMLAEAAGDDAESVGLVSRVGRKALAAGASVALAITVGGATGLSTVLVDRHLDQQASATASLDQLDALVAFADESHLRWRVQLLDPGEKRINCNKVIRELTGLGLSEAKRIVDGAPATVLFVETEAAATEAVKALEAVGASATYERRLESEWTNTPEENSGNGS